MPKKNIRPVRDVKPVFHVYCEGEKTEPNYLNGYINKSFPTNRRLKIINIEDTRKNTPVQLVEVAVKAKKEYPDGDVFWVVYDRESEQKYKNELHFQAYEKAQSHTIKAAISNVCFEIWLLLHFQETIAPYSNFDDLRKNSALRTECERRGLLDYDKASQDIFGIFTEKEIADARTRAEKLNKLTEQSADPSCTRPYQWNPYTDVHKLLDAMDEFVKNQKI